ncbi:MAG TPA: SDR family NAD(P)-dependent oxidoreductase [Chloroflexota bacterium]|nr:SDR family NAD(P)-dependent oxidoreductase [Chloroflexota bacterium]
MGKLDGRVAIVTGGGNGIGIRYCKAIAGEGSAVVVAELDGQAAGRVADEIGEDGGRALAVQTDVSDSASVRHMVDETIREFGKIDILVNNAAVFATIPISRVGIEDLTEDEWDLVYRVNMKGMFLVTKAVVPHMKKQRYGKIVNIGSGSMLDGGGGRAHYTSAKAAVVGFTRVLAHELGDYNVCVNTLAPGSTLSEANPTPDIVKMREAAVRSRVIKRVQTPEDLVGPMLFLLSPDSDFMTGQMLVADGGTKFY